MDSDSKGDYVRAFDLKMGDMLKINQRLYLVVGVNELHGAIYVLLTCYPKPTESYDITVYRCNMSDYVKICQFRP